MKRILIITIFLIAVLQSCSPKHLLIREYKASANGKEMTILLYSDSTYIFNTFWGTYHGIWKIDEITSDSLFDDIRFLDNDFVEENCFFVSHILINDTLVSQEGGLSDNPKVPFVTMYDLTGDNILFHQICYYDINKNIIHNGGNPEKAYKHPIPINTKRIFMVGDRKDFNSYFECDYSLDEGSIAFIMGPYVERFHINKKRDVIVYQPCHCNDYHAECAIVFKRHKD